MVLPQTPSHLPQVTLSYGVFEGKLNIIKLQGPFSHEEDPSRWVWAEVQGGGGDLGTQGRKSLEGK